jgi:predicted dinucleotide-utilizing enzyme
MLSHVSNSVWFIVTMAALQDQNLDPKISKKPEQSLQEIANPSASILDLDSFDSHHTSILLMVLKATSPNWNLDNKISQKTEQYLQTARQFLCNYHLPKETQDISTSVVN